MQSSGECFICEGSLSEEGWGEDYIRCSSCGHETLVAKAPNVGIINEALTTMDVRWPSLLDRYQVSTALRASHRREFIVDFGCGPGRFLYFVKRYFDQHLGIEITPECRVFARTTLDVKVEAGWQQDKRAASLVTFWHSLEHLSADQIREQLHTLTLNANTETRVLISVPNGASILYRIAGRRDPFYDVPHHLHNFSRKSLVEVFARSGWSVEKEYRSFIYSAFAWTQYFLNLIEPIHNYYYYRKKRQKTFELDARSLRKHDFQAKVLMPVAALLTLPFLLIDIFHPHRSPVLTISFKPDLVK